MSKRVSFLLVFAILHFSVIAQLKVASVIGDNMVLQQNSKIKIWGKSTAGHTIKVSASWSADANANAVANQYGDWLVTLPTIAAGGPYQITISDAKEKMKLNNLLLGEVWLCSGQSNMEMVIAGMFGGVIKDADEIINDADNNNIRVFTVTRNSVPTLQDTCSGSWKIANSENVGNFSAVAYLYAKQLEHKLNVPIGIISTSFGGSKIEAWMSKEKLANYPEPLKEASQPKTAIQNKASQLFNGMINPVLNYTIKGAIWYQGESNIVNYKDYPDLMVGLVSDWRSRFGVGDFPFYFVEIAPYWYNNSSAFGAALQRGQQQKAALLIPNSGIVSTVDIGEEKCIHPADKATVAKRLAYLALSETYQKKGYNVKSPTYKSVAFKDSVATVTLDNAVSGMTSFGKVVDGFEVAGADSIYHKATATINRKLQIEVVSSQVKNPVAVRYAFRNYFETRGWFYNAANLPLPPFRTDNWEVK